jgi:hypothetical protein
LLNGLVLQSSRHSDDRFRPQHQQQCGSTAPDDCFARPGAAERTIELATLRSRRPGVGRTVARFRFRRPGRRIGALAFNGRRKSARDLGQGAERSQIRPDGRRSELAVA